MNPIIFSPGQIIKLSGDSGNGKSTFTDIVCGIIPYKEYKHCIYYDNKENTYGFDAITTHRLYVEQFETIDWRPSVYEIITEQHVEDSCIINMNTNDEDIVWTALEMACCQDFLKRSNDMNDLKWIHTKNIDPSGGQKGRIAIARILYHMLKKFPKMIILDEVDKAFQGELATTILSGIFAYCRANKIICLVAAHSTEVKEMKYDQVLVFDHGKIN